MRPSRFWLSTMWRSPVRTDSRELLALGLFDRGSHPCLGEQYPHAPWSIGIFAKTHEPDVNHLMVRYERPYVRLPETQIIRRVPCSIASPGREPRDHKYNDARQLTDGASLRPHYTALVRAPSMIRLVPEMRLATGLARNTTPAATSSAVPIRPVGFSDIAVL